VQKLRDEAVAQLEDTHPRELDRDEVLLYVEALKALLSHGTFMEQKAFLRSFIKRIEFDPGQVAIDYTVPMPIDKDTTSEREVLSIRRYGSPLFLSKGCS